jgi:hypothetical protein
MTDAVVTLAQRHVRAHTTGELRYDERQQPVRFVFDPATGKLVISVMVAMLDAVDTVLFIPEERDGAMELLLTLAPLAQEGAGEALADRWRIYHGEPEDMHFAIASIEACRHESFVIDGEALQQPNALATDEPRLCKLLNEVGKDRLAALTFARANRRIESPVAVGVDQFGFDVRARFEIVRLAAPESWASAADAERDISAWLTMDAGP